MPVRPPAPTRVSITIACPSTVAIFSVKMRLIVSAGPPARDGTTNFTARFGNSWVIARLGHAETKNTNTRRIKVNMATYSCLAPRTRQQKLLPLSVGVRCLRRRQALKSGRFDYLLVELARRRGAVTRHVGRDDGSDDAAIPVPMLWRYREAVGRTGETRLSRLTALVGLGYLFVWT